MVGFCQRTSLHSLSRYSGAGSVQPKHVLGILIAPKNQTLVVNEKTDRGTRTRRTHTCSFPGNPHCRKIFAASAWLPRCGSGKEALQETR